MEKYKACMAACAFLISGIFIPKEILLAGSENNPVGARAAGLGYTAITISDVWANFFNQAALASLQNMAFGFHHENAFQLKQLSLKALAAVIPVKPGTFGVNGCYFGYEKFHESKIGIAFAHKLTKRISAGIQLDYLSIYSADENPKSKCFTFEMGFMAELSKELKLGVHLFNPANIQYYGRREESISPVASIGLGYSKAERLLFSLEVEKNLRYEPVYRAGIEYLIRKFMFLRTGVSTNPLQNHFGMGFKLKKFQIDMAFSRHLVLGYSQYLSLEYAF